MFKGSMVALITPFTKKGSLDEKSLERLINWHLDSKTDALVLSGTTGEAPTLLDSEKIKIFEMAVKLAKNKTKIIAGTGTYSTQKTVDLTKKAKDIGVDGALIVVPYYSKPTIAGLAKHFEEIAKTDLPLILYHHPGRTGTRLSIENFIQLEEINNIVAIKEASGNLEFAKELINKTRFDVLSGDDPLTIDMMKAGAKGVISVIANILPSVSKHITDLCLEKRYDEAKKIYDQNQELFNSMFIESNPIPIKFALSILNYCESKMRLPLIEPHEQNQQIIKNILKNYKK